VEQRANAGRRRRSGLVDAIARWQLLATFGLVAVALGLVALLVMARFVHAPQVRDQVQAMALARAGHEAMLDQHSGLRAYAATGDDRFLESFDRGRAAQDELDGQLEALVGDRLPDLVLRTRLAQAAWTDRWVPQALAAGAAGGASGQAEEALLVEGKELFDVYRAAAGALGDRLVDERDDAVDDLEEAITRTAALASAVALALIGFVWLGGVRLRQRLARAFDGLDARVDRIRSGDLAPVPAPSETEPLELERIHHGLEAASADLGASRAALEDQAERIATHNRQLAQVLRFAREVAGSLNLRYVLRGLCSAAGEIARARVVVWLRTEDGDHLEAVADSDGPDLAPIGLDPVVLGEGVVGRAARFGRIHTFPEGEGLGATEAVGRATEVLAVPMVVGAEVTGTIEVRLDRTGHLGATAVSVLEALAVQAATAVSAARLHERTTIMAMTDALTRLPNRRRLEQDLAREIGVSLRHGRPLAFAMADVDHFKAYNDELGHQAADVALQSLAHLLANSVRAGDTVYRYGGEELAILLREADPEDASQMADRLRALVEHHFAAPGQPRPVTISVGVAALGTHASTAAELVEAADRALYEAKRAGRNQVVVAGS
jgi:diguanylate cyclase (GGDEF)-like protein